MDNEYDDDNDDMERFCCTDRAYPSEKIVSTEMREITAKQPDYTLVKVTDSQGKRKHPLNQETSDDERKHKEIKKKKNVEKETEVKSMTESVHSQQL